MITVRDRQLFSLRDMKGLLNLPLGWDYSVFSSVNQENYFSRSVTVPITGYYTNMLHFRYYRKLNKLMKK